MRVAFVFWLRVCTTSDPSLYTLHTLVMEFRRFLLIARAAVRERWHLAHTWTEAALRFLHDIINLPAWLIREQWTILWSITCDLPINMQANIDGSQEKSAIQTWANSANRKRRDWNVERFHSLNLPSNVDDEKIWIIPGLVAWKKRDFLFPIASIWWMKNNPKNTSASISPSPCSPQSALVTTSQHCSCTRKSINERTHFRHTIACRIFHAWHLVIKYPHFSAVYRLMMHATDDIVVRHLFVWYAAHTGDCQSNAISTVKFIFHCSFHSSAIDARTPHAACKGNINYSARIASMQIVHRARIHPFGRREQMPARWHCWHWLCFVSNSNSRRFCFQLQAEGNEWKLVVKCIVFLPVPTGICQSEGRKQDIPFTTFVYLLSSTELTPMSMKFLMNLTRRIPNFRWQYTLNSIDDVHRIEYESMPPGCRYHIVVSDGNSLV